MKRGFLFGLGSFLIIAALASLIGFLRGAFTAVALIVGFGCIPLGVLVIRMAMSAPPHQSRRRAFMGWCVGFFLIDAIISAAIAAAILVPQLIK